MALEILNHGHLVLFTLACVKAKHYNGENVAE